MEDLMEMANEVQETMGRSYGLPDDLDEDDLEAGNVLFNLELDALQDEVLLEESEPSYLDSLPEASDAIPGGFNKAQEQEQPQKIGV
jgi:charged multivesicular body protein 5